jgi:hypothetical protein
VPGMHQFRPQLQVCVPHVGCWRCWDPGVLAPRVHAIQLRATVLFGELNVRCVDLPPPSQDELFDDAGQLDRVEALVKARASKPGLVLCASLLENVPNLAGLSRCVWVFVGAQPPSSPSSFDSTCCTLAPSPCGMQHTHAPAGRARRCPPRPWWSRVAPWWRQTRSRSSRGRASATYV